MIKKEINSEGMITHEDDGTVVIATKVSKKFLQKLTRLCEKGGTTVFQLLRNCVSTFVKYTDKEENLSPEISHAMMLFENGHDWKKNYTLADPYAEPVVVEALYFLKDKELKGYNGVLVSLPFMGERTQNLNVQAQVERTLELLQPTLYRKVRAIGVELGSQSVLQTLQLLVTMHASEADEQALRAEFEDNDRSEYGVKPDRTQYKRKMHHSVDDPSLHFDDEPSKDFRPLGGEW